MAKIIISADYFGNVIQSIRQKDEVSALKLAHLLGCDIKQLHQYEEGKELIPSHIARRIIKYAAMTDSMLEKD